MPTRTAQKMLLVAVEGLDSVMLEDSVTTNIQVLRQAGASTLQAGPVPGLSSAAGLFSLLTSTTAFAADGRPSSPIALQAGLVHHAHRRGLVITVFHNSAGLNRLLSHETAEDFCYLNCSVEDSDFRIMHLAAESIRVGRPDLCFICLNWNEHPPVVRHSSAERENLHQVETCDRALSIILNMMSLFGLFRQYHILFVGIPAQRNLVCARANAAQARAPWIVVGPRVKAGYAIAGKVSILDTTPTIARLLSLPQIPSWEGRPVEEIFMDCGTELQSVA